ncbi:hypothetical protein D3C85_1060230 [compost metagenome]
MTPVSVLRISSSHSSSKASFRFVRSRVSIAGRSSSRAMAVNPATPREITVPATRPANVPMMLATPLVVISDSSCSLVRWVIDDNPESVIQAPAPLGVLRMRSIRAT